MKWLVEKKIFGFGVALVTLIIVGLISYWSTTKLIDTTYWVARTNKIIIELEDVLLRMEKIQNGELDYIITGKEPYLEPCYAAIEKIDQEK